MATTVSTDVKLYDEQFQGAFIETLQQNTAGFNAATRGALVLRNRIIPGSYSKEAFWDEVSSIARRDPTADSTSAAASTKLTQDEFISVKLDRRNGPYEVNIDSFRKIGREWGREFSRVVGAQTAAAMPKEQLDRVLAALEAKLDSVAALDHDRTAGTMRSEDLVDGLANFGDAAGRIAIWVMHSKVFYDLLKDQVTGAESVYGAEAFAGQIFRGMPVTLNRPVFVTDSASLVETDGVSSGVDKYSTLGLVSGAGVIEISAPPIAVLEGPMTGADNLYVRWQAEYSYNIGIKGCQWDTTAGGTNPTDNAVATATNWDTVVADNKLLPGVMISSR